jgi:hypothetical protein
LNLVKLLTILPFNSHCQKKCEFLSSLGVRRLSSVTFLHFIIFLWNRLAKWTETWYAASERSSIQVGHLSRFANKNGRQFLNSSHLRLLGQMNRNIVGSMKLLWKIFLFLSRLGNKPGRQGHFLFLLAKIFKIFSSETRRQH